LEIQNGHLLIQNCYKLESASKTFYFNGILKGKKCLLQVPVGPSSSRPGRDNPAQEDTVAPGSNQIVVANPPDLLNWNTSSKNILTGYVLNQIVLLFAFI
jgi:ABC-type taurine transport system ATPase subunit